ncbi:MAG: hypothetical protein HRT61_22470 [Ekhidna sp.]|nr:hypothetical protein [Ekhidna sp.]
MFQHRVNIEIKDGYEEPRNFQFESIYAYRTSIDIESFKQLDELSQRKEILELVHKGFISLANEFGWDTNAIADAYNKSIKDNYEFVYRTDSKLSRNKKYKGSIRINLTGRLTTFTSELLNIQTEELQTTQLLQTEQGNFAWWRSIREFGWMDSDNFGLKLMKGEVWITSNTHSFELTETFKPKKNSNKLLEGFLKELKEPIQSIKSTQHTI